MNPFPYISFPSPSQEIKTFAITISYASQLSFVIAFLPLSYSLPNIVTTALDSHLATMDLVIEAEATSVTTLWGPYFLKFSST